MGGFIDNGLPNITTFAGSERVNLDTQLSGGASPQSGYVSLQKLAAALLMLGNNQDVTGIANQRFSAEVSLGVTSTTLGAPSLPVLLNGIEFLIGTTGGTDKWIGELHDSAGVFLVGTDTAGTTVGTASTWQRIPFGTAAAPTPYLAQPGSYFITLIMNGTTAKFRAYNSPGLLILTQSASGGTFGTPANITPPTTYTAAVGPVAVLY